MSSSGKQPMPPGLTLSMMLNSEGAEPGLCRCSVCLLSTLLVHAPTAEVRKIIHMGFLSCWLMQIPHDSQGKMGEIILL